MTSLLNEVKVNRMDILEDLIGVEFKEYYYYHWKWIATSNNHWEAKWYLLERVKEEYND